MLLYAIVSRKFELSGRRVRMVDIVNSSTHLPTISAFIVGNKQHSSGCFPISTPRQPTGSN